MRKKDLQKLNAALSEQADVPDGVLDKARAELQRRQAVLSASSPSFASPNKRRGVRAGSVLVANRGGIVFGCACAAMILCAAVLIASDFGGNMYKTVFGTNKSRVTILRGRFFAYLIYLAVLFAVAVVIISVTSLSYGLPFQHIICVVAGNVFVLPPVTYLVITFALWAVFLLEYAVAIFGISACCKNIFAALAFPAAYYGGIVALSGTDAVPGATSLFGKEIYALNGTFGHVFFGYYPLWCYIAAFIAKLLLAAIFLALGTIIYQKRQL